FFVQAQVVADTKNTSHHKEKVSGGRVGYCQDCIDLRVLGYQSCYAGCCANRTSQLAVFSVERAMRI
ncbi:hypothetical protein, partial [Acinetobacter indicus]|uniref:hypothetical protein n=1 Tax=Acinetobacter indicus TaxID=756892 RepID=UPI001BB4643A